MLDNNNYNCEFAGELLSYLYGEIGKREKSEFETHLNSCSNCAEELAGFGSIRSSILDWQLEFTKLQTPIFILPIENARRVSETFSAEKVSWLAEFRKLFTVSPFSVRTAFAALAICLGLTIFIFIFSNNSKNSEIAINEVNKNVAPIVSATVENVLKQTDQNEVNKSVIKPTTDKYTNLPESKAENLQPDKISPERTNKQYSKNSFVKVSVNSNKTGIDRQSAQNTNVLSVAKNPEIYKKDKKTILATRQNTSKLVEDEETEDDSVRLADLFDEIDTKR